MTNTKKLVKIDKENYSCEGYELKKDWTWHGKRLHRIWRLYKDGKCIGQPETVNMANEWIKNHENH